MPCTNCLKTCDTCYYEELSRELNGICSALNWEYKIIIDQTIFDALATLPSSFIPFIERLHELERRGVLRFFGKSKKTTYITMDLLNERYPGNQCRALNDLYNSVQDIRKLLYSNNKDDKAI